MSSSGLSTFALPHTHRAKNQLMKGYLPALDDVSLNVQPFSKDTHTKAIVQQSKLDHFRSHSNPVTVVIPVGPRTTRWAMTFACKFTSVLNDWSNHLVGQGARKDSAENMKRNPATSPIARISPKFP